MILRALAAALLGCVISVSTPALAVDPAGGPPHDPDSQEELIGPDAPDASLSERSWLGESSASSHPEALGGSSSAGSGFTLGALIILLGLGGAAIALHLKRQKSLPIPKHESRLDVLSSSRIGPKAFAVTAHVGGRVMLLGVTDHNVTLLTWLDTDDADDAETEDENEASEADDAGLPDDYPGSALRESSPGASAAVRQSAVHSKKAFASSHDLKRFQEVLRGAIHLKSDAPLLRAPLSSPPSAASTLAAQTADVVFAGGAAPRASAPPQESPAAPADAPLASLRPASLRRKRQRRNENAAPRAKTRGATSADVLESLVEGQVAGLERLKGGS